MQMYNLCNRKTPCIVLSNLSLSFSNIFGTTFYVNKCNRDAVGVGNRHQDQDLSAGSSLGSALKINTIVEWS